MKNALNIAVILSVMVLFGCSKDDSSKPLTFDEKVSEITKNKQFKPALTDFVNLEWTCTDWKLSFYNSIEMVGEWNSYKNTILDEEKSQIYKFDSDKLDVLKSQNLSGVLQNVSQKATAYTWDNTGVLNINGISYIVKMQDDKLYLYYNTKDIVKVGESFNVTVDNTYGHSLEQEGGVIGVGLIQFTKKEITQTNQQSTDNIFSLLTKYINRDDILNQKFNIIETSSTDHMYTLSGGSDNLKHHISLTDLQVNLTTIAPARANLLFNAFVTKTVFNFKGVDLKINKIEHEDGGPFSFYVYGVTSLTGEAVKFYYYTSNVTEYWIIAPTVDTKLIVGIWSYYRTGNSIVTYGVTSKYEYRADNTFVRELLDYKEIGTWSVNADKTKLKIVVSKRLNKATQLTTDYDLVFDYDIILVSKTKMILSSKWFNGTVDVKDYFSKV